MRKSTFALIFVMLFCMAAGCASREGPHPEQQQKTHEKQTRDDNASTQRPGGPADPYGVGGRYGNPYGVRRSR